MLDVTRLATSLAVLAATMVLVTCQNPTWILNDVSMPVPLQLSSFVTCNGSSVIVGGCLDIACRAKSQGLYLYQEVDGLIVTMPSSLATSIAGVSACVVVLNSIVCPRACSMWHGGVVTTAVLELHSSVVRIDGKEWTVNDNFISIPKPRANASCVSFGDTIYIIGGVRLPSMEAAVEIDAIVFGAEVPLFETNVSVLPTDAVTTYGDAAVINIAAVGADNEGIYVALVNSSQSDGLVPVGVYGLFPKHSYNAMELFATAMFPSSQAPTMLQLSLFNGQMFLTGGANTLFVYYQFLPNNGAVVSISQGSDSSGGSLSLADIGLHSSGLTLDLLMCGGLSSSSTLLTSCQTLQTAFSFPSPQLITVISNKSRVRYDYLQFSAMLIEVGDALEVTMSDLAVNGTQFRLSTSPTCTLPLDGSQDVSWDSGFTFLLNASSSSPATYLCFSSGQVFLIVDSESGKQFPVLLFTPSNIFQPFIIQGPSPGLPTVPSQNSIPLWLIIVSAVGFLFVIFVAGMICRTVLRSAGHYSERERVAAENIGNSNKYSIVKKLGSGGNGEVFLVKRRKDAELFAVKHVRCRGGKSRDDLFRETDMLERLKGHPNMIKIIEMSLHEQYVEDSSDRGASSNADATSGCPTGSTVAGINTQDEPEMPPLSHPLFDEGLAAELAAEKDAAVEKSRSSKSTAARRLVRYQCIVMEYCSKGDLASWVLSRRTRDGSARAAPDSRDRDDDSSVSGNSRRSGSVLSGATGTLAGGNSSSVREEVVVSIAFQVLSLLKFLHSRKPRPIIHCDLKPENILVMNKIHGHYLKQITSPQTPSADRTRRMQSGLAKEKYQDIEDPESSPLLRSQQLTQLSETFVPVVVTDFGQALEFEEERISDVKLHQVTLPFVAPECVASGMRKVTPKIDIWALGCVLYGICTKRLRNADTPVMFEEVRNPSFADDLRLDICTVHGYSPQLANLILTMLEADSELRPKAGELIENYIVTSGPLSMTCVFPPGTRSEASIM